MAGVRVAALAAAALAIGIAVGGGAGDAAAAGERAQAGSAATSAEVRAHRAAERRARRALGAFRRAVVADADDTAPRRLARLARHAATVGRALDAMERSGAPAGTVRWRGGVLDRLRDAHGHMTRYVELGRAGERMRMQTTVWRFLWVLNAVPGPLIR